MNGLVRSLSYPSVPIAVRRETNKECWGNAGDSFWLRTLPMHLQNRYMWTDSFCTPRIRPCSSTGRRDELYYIKFTSLLRLITRRNIGLIACCYRSFCFDRAAMPAHILRLLRRTTHVLSLSNTLRTIHPHRSRSGAEKLGDVQKVRFPRSLQWDQFSPCIPAPR